MSINQELPSFKVRVNCMTYNHALFIKDAMNGFCIQRTNFPFVCTIIDDASTDGETEVINQYLKDHFDLKDKSIVRNEENENYLLKFARHKENKNCYFAILFLKYNHYSSLENRRKKLQYIKEWDDVVKYMANCEGDDYWIDPQKLQKQFDILENNNKVMMVYTNYETVDENKNIIVRPVYDKYKSYSKSGDILPILFKSNFPLTLTVMVRTEVYQSSLYKNAPASLDYLLFVSASFIGDAFYISEKTGAYRLNPNGMMHKGAVRTSSAYSLLFPYIFIEYAKGKHKKETFWNDILIKHRIMLKSLSIYLCDHDKSLIFSLLNTNKILILFLLTGCIEKIINKIIKVFNIKIL